MAGVDRLCEAMADQPPGPSPVWAKEESVSSGEGQDLEEQPFLQDQEVDIEEKPSRQRQRIWSCKLLVWLLLLTTTVFVLAGVALNLKPRSNGGQHADSSAHQEDDFGKTQDPQQHNPGRIKYADDLPDLPQLRPASQYELPPAWDFDAPPIIREYTWTVADAELNPDGIYRPMMLINNQFPGPLIECNDGDTIIVHIENTAVNATSMHFHGLYQNGTNSMDGTVGITQCAIAPNSTFTYEFTVSGQSGTYWYHAHHSMQAVDGLFGPMVIHSKDEKKLQELEYATDRVVMVQDYYHNTTSELLVDYLRPRSENDEPVPDNALINGRGMRRCDEFPGWRCDTTNRSATTWELEAGQRHRLRFINVGAFAEFQIQFDEHPFHITEVDGTDVHPEPFHRLNILPAQRYSIVIETNVTTAESFWMRARMVTHCFTTENPRLQPEIQAIVRYSSPESVSSAVQPEPTSKEWSDAIEVVCRDLNTSALHPVLPITPPPADDFITLRANFMIGDWKLSRGFFNDSTWRGNATHPSLHRLLDTDPSVVISDNTSSGVGINTYPFDSSRELVLQTNGIRTVDIAINSFDDGSHPFHLHGHKFFVLAQARSGYPPAPHEIPAYIEENNLLDNPLRRDVVTVEGYAWTLIRVVLDNPGLWALHCHNAWHADAGMVMQLLVRPDEVFKSHVSPQQKAMCQLEGVTRGGRPDDSTWYGDFS